MACRILDIFLFQNSEMLTKNHDVKISRIVLTKKTKFRLYSLEAFVWNPYLVITGHVLVIKHTNIFTQFSQKCLDDLINPDLHSD